MSEPYSKEELETIIKYQKTDGMIEPEVYSETDRFLATIAQRDERIAELEGGAFVQACLDNTKLTNHLALAEKVIGKYGDHTQLCACVINVHHDCNCGYEHTLKEWEEK